MTGFVSLVGAGPGDPDLLTRRAVDRLARADLILNDALVPADLLELAPKARRFFVGKRAGRHSIDQDGIHALMIRAARRGQRVVRLKCGDPFVLGRGGEEALALAAARVPFRIVPGITAGVAGLAYAGIPTTHRETNAAVTFVTGHGAGGEVPDGLDWEALSKGAPVLVIYMGLRHLSEIVVRLIAAGRDPETPVAIIASATLPNQRVLVTTLAGAAAAAEAARIEPPTIVAVGEVVRLRATLDWLGTAAR